MNFKKDLSSVAAEVAKIMEAELSAKQKQIAKMSEPKHKIDAGDLAKLRAGHKPVKEEQEQVEEGIEDKIEAARKKAKAAGKKVEEPKKPAAPAKRKVEGKAYGGAKQKEEMEESVLPFTSMLEAYTEHGLKAFVNEQVEEEVQQEEVDNETYTKEVKDQIASMEGKKKQPKVAAAATQGVKIMDEEVEQIEERTLSEPETEKKEEYVKGMKKKLSGFKQRYGERAKEVMYATATKMAKKD